MLLLAPGVIAIGVGERTSPAGAEALARSVFDDGLAHTVLVVPIEQRRASMHLDTGLHHGRGRRGRHVSGHSGHPGGVHSAQGRRRGEYSRCDRRSSKRRPTPWESENWRVIDTGLDTVTAEREQWDDGNNTLAVEPGVVVAYERNVETNARLEASGIEVLRIAGSELGSGRGGPRCMSCPIARDPL